MNDEIRAMSNRDLLVAYSDAKEECQETQGELDMHYILRPQYIEPRTMVEEAEIVGWEETEDVLLAYVEGSTEYKEKLEREMARRDLLRATRRQVDAQEITGTASNVIILEDYWTHKKAKVEKHVTVSW